MAATYSTTRLSSKGQVVIPEEVRTHLGLKEGDQFMVIGQGDAVILKSIAPPRIEEFETLLARARAEGRGMGIKKKDVKATISKVRRKR
jgi:AbrB family looped-hinge helix DNA binding protein